MKNLTRAICFAALIFLSVNFPAAAQIKIPKIFKPKQNPPVETPAGQIPAPQTPNERNQMPQNSASRNRQSGDQLYTPYGNYIDDGFTWFESVPTQELDAKQMAVPTGWTLKSTVRMMGAYPKRSAFKFVVSRAGKVLGTTRCEASTYNIPSTNPADVSFVFTDGCADKTAATKEIGKFDVEVFLIDGATNAEQSVRKYKIDVLRVERVNGQIGKFAKPDAPRYVISRHAEAPVSFLYLRPAKSLNYTTVGERDGNNQVEIHYSISPFKDINSEHAALRCSVNGSPLKLPGDTYRSDLAVSNAERRYEEIYSDRLAPKYQTGPAYHDNFGFELVRVTLPLTYGRANSDETRININDYPGNWECSMRVNGETYRTWRWKIQADGMPEMHAEQKGNINLHPNAFLIETEIPAAGSPLDKRLAPVSAAEGFFYGQKWTSAAGKAMAAKVPAKGSPTPVPSNKIQ